MPELNRMFRVSVVNTFGRLLNGAIVRLHRDGKPKAEGSIDREPYVFQVTAPGKVEVEAIYKGARKKREVAPDEDFVRIRLAPLLTLRNVAAAAALAAAVVFIGVRILNSGLVSPGAPSVTSAYVGNGPHKKAVAVVFVHGIFGDQSTWGAQKTSFPEMLISDPEFYGKVDAFLFEYYSPRFGPASNVSELAKQLKAALEDNHVFDDHERVAFLCHSMGGLIARRALILLPDVRKIAMLYFYATPTNGAEITKLARRISSSPQLRSMLPLEGNEALQQIEDDWVNRPDLRAIPSYCAYETLPTDGVFVVTQSSARALCNRLPEAMNANHMEIVKPSSRTDPRYSRFATALRKEAFPAVQVSAGK